MLLYCCVQKESEMTDLTSKIEIARVIEAFIFASVKPVSSKELVSYIGEFDLDEIIELIQRRYSDASGVELQMIGGDHYAFRTHCDVAARLNIERPVERPLSRAAMEVLSIIAYHQPITRSEIEEIRGISLSRGTIDILLDLDWIKPRGRKRTPGRPLTWVTTTAFLDYFGLSELNDLPGMDELKSAGLLRKGQSIGGLGEQELFPDIQESIEPEYIEEKEGALLFEEDSMDKKTQNLSNDLDKLEEIYEIEHKEV